MLGASLYAATWVINEVGPENFDEGDVWIHNDPYRGGSHMPEHMMTTPIYIDGEIVAYVGNIAQAEWKGPPAEVLKKLNLPAQ